MFARKNNIPYAVNCILIFIQLATFKALFPLVKKERKEKGGVGQPGMCVGSKVQT